MQEFDEIQGTGEIDDDAIRALQEAFYVLICTYKENYQRLGAADQSDCREELKRANRTILETIFTLIEPKLRRLARRLLTTERARQEILSSAASFQEDVLAVITYDLFTYIIADLHKLDPDPKRSIDGLLVTVADRGWCNDRIYRSSPKHVPLEEASLDDAALARDSVEVPVLDTIHQTAIGQCFQTFMGRRDSIDQRIAEERMADPPTPFKIIAQKLGAGYAEPMLRKRWERMLKQFHQEISDLGLLEK